MPDQIARVENAGPEKMLDQIAGVENAGPENDGPGNDSSMY